MTMEPRLVQYNTRVSRKLRSNTTPLQAEYVRSEDNGPRTLTTFVNGVSEYKTLVQPNTKHSDSTVNTAYGDSYHAKYSDRSVNIDVAPIAKYKDISNIHYNNYLTATNKPLYKYMEPSYVTSVNPYTEPSLAQYNIEYSQAKAKSKFDSDYVPAKIKSDASYERLKSMMHYRLPPDAMLNEYSYNSVHDYHTDDNDVRTSSRSPYDNWPYFYHSPYEYEHIKSDSVMQKAKDKRFAIDTGRKIIPVHEEIYHENAGVAEYNTPLTPTYYTSTPDNPFSGHQPFFSFVLNDYFDKNTDEDALTFKGLNLDKEFDYDSELNSDADDYGKRNRRLQNNYDYPVDDNIGSTNFEPDHNYENIKESQDKTATDKTYDRKQEYDKYDHDRGHKYNSDLKSQYNDKSHRYKGFKDFVDTFANNFGSQDTKKKSNYLLSRNQDKGEKRKGFHRVYHKDEYQEDNEFYDNTHNSAKADEKGESAVHVGGTEAYLGSHSSANLGNETNAYTKAGNTHTNKYENKHSGHKKINASDREIQKYRDVARKAAQSNDADYTDHNRINK